MRVGTLAALCILALFKPDNIVNISYPKAQDITWLSDTVSIVFAGDIMMHAKQLDYDYTSFLNPISDYLSSADLTVANFEFTLAGEPYSGYPRFCSPDEFAQSLVNKNGVDVILTANNHILDKGSKGFSRTLTKYSELNAYYTGSGFEDNFESINPLIISRKGIKFAFINFTYGTNLGSDTLYPKVFRNRKSDILAAIQRAQDADFIIALPHWGIEYELTHSEAQEELASWLISQGVDLIIGSHPHVVQDIGTIDGVTVVYSLGNLVSNMTTKDTRKGLVVKFTFKNDYTTGLKTIESYETHHTWCKLPLNKDDNFQVVFTD